MNRPTLTVRDLVLGDGEPKLIVPITGRAVDGLVAETRAVAASPAHIVEFRADYFEGHRDPGTLVDAVRAVAAAAGRLLVLFTIRTAAEGGESDLAPELYLELVAAVAQAGAADLIDVEYRHPQAAAAMEQIHAAGGLVVASNHDFNATPEHDEIVARLARMEEMGADVAKLAVMPRSAADVATLQLATAHRAEQARRPLLTMSMGPLGGITRLNGEVFGSVATFATVGAASAPGQMAIADVIRVLDIVHGSRPLG